MWRRLAPAATVATLLLAATAAPVPSAAVSAAGDPVQGPPPQAQPIFGAGRGLEITLEGALQLALKNNLALQREDLSSEAAMYAAKGSWGAFDWVVNANGGVTDTEFESESVFGGSSTNSQIFGVEFVKPLAFTGGHFRASFDTINTDTDNTFAALPTSTTDIVSLSYVQPLLRGAWRQYATAQQTIADMDWRRQLEHEREIRQRMLFNVSNAYWDLVAARADVEVSTSSLDLGKTQLDQDRRRLEAGVGTRIDVLSAETTVAQREQLLLAADVLVRQRADDLRKLILPGADAERWETALVPSTPLPEETPPIAPGWEGALETALSQRAELRQQRLVIDEFKLIHEVRVSEKRPLLDLSLGASSKGFDGDSSDAFDEAVRYEFPTYSAFLNFSYPIGNQTAKGAERVAWTNLRAANLTYDELETQIASEVREALRQLIYAAEAVRAAQKSLDLATQQLDAEEKRHQEGISTNFQVLSFQQDLTQSQFSERNARARYAKALAAVQATQGLIGEDLAR